MVKRPERPRPVKDAQRGGQVGGIVEKEGPIHVSNVMLLDPKDNKPTRVGVRRDKGGKRERFAKRAGRRSDGGDRDTSRRRLRRRACASATSRRSCRR